ncbi:hypothetical protein [Pararhodobacter marinus]|uniref:hypothetical protein n=1 Tax=Pararhodobacter marinus TaxID=2184063 RepID=UPI00143CC381|nr:hypothetical protein [Pararhodobacter marinus]
MPAARPTAPLRARIAPQLPVASFLVGQPVARVAMLLPRLFNLCQAAQAQALAVALGTGAAPDCCAEIRRDHLLKLFVTWPGHLGLGARALPKDWAQDADSVRLSLFGARQIPAAPADFDAFLASGRGVAPVLRAIESRFAPHEAASARLPFVTPGTLWSRAPVENSIAMRHADSPIVAGIETRCGRGPLWRAVARLLDLVAVLDRALPPALSPEPGLAIVPATRGAYGLRLVVRDGHVAVCDRVTPSDSLLAPGGVLDQSLASLDAARAGLGPLLLDILDPCVLVTLDPVTPETIPDRSAPSPAKAPGPSGTRRSHSSAIAPETAPSEQPGSAGVTSSGAAAAGNPDPTRSAAAAAPDVTLRRSPVGSVAVARSDLAAGPAIVARPLASSGVVATARTEHDTAPGNSLGPEASIPAVPDPQLAHDAGSLRQSRRASPDGTPVGRLGAARAARCGPCKAPAVTETDHA